MEHEGKPLAADETGPSTGRQPGVASVHVRALVTWLAIFPMVALGMSVLGVVGQQWHPVLRALVLTLLVVPTAVYVLVPRLLMAYGHAHRVASRKRTARKSTRS
ncbi:hypothetical protein [Microbacterium sp. NPDC055683]